MRNLHSYIQNPVFKELMEWYARATTPEELEAAKRHQREQREGKELFHIR